MFLGKINFRVIHDSDRQFLIELYGNTRAWEFENSIWSNEERDVFIKRQFELQDQSYKANYIGAIHRIIQLDDMDIGRLIVNRSNDIMHIIDLSILSAYQGRGIGTDILKSLINEAQGGKVPVTLSVEQNNPALHLYNRLGFQQVGVTGHHLSLKWEPYRGAREI